MSDAFAPAPGPRFSKASGLLFLAVAVLLAGGPGCGYSLVGRASNIPEDVQAVYFHTLENRTARSQIEQVLSRAIVDELVTRQRFSMAESPGAADAEIRGTVMDFKTSPVTFGDDGRATELEITITVKMVFQRVAASEDEKPETLWRNDRYLFREQYEIDPDAANYVDLEDQSIEEISVRFAETMVSDLLEGF